jgi:hypothetical protein
MRKWTTYLLLAAFASAVMLFALASPLGNALAARLGPKILNATRGKIADPVVFVTGRLREVSLLLGTAAALCLFYTLVRRATAYRPSGWAVLGVTAFAGVNLLVLAAMHTALFWIALYMGDATASVTQFNFKKQLLAEHRAEREILLLGSSQTQAQINENILNQELGPKAWTTELHFPGSRSLDLLLVARRLRGEPGTDVVCYLSEYYFYPGLYTTAAPYFVSLADIPLLKRLGFGREMLTQPYGLGFLAEAMPLFACREPLSQRILGRAMTALEQAKHNANLQTNLVLRAEEWAQPFKLDENATRQKNAFIAFVQELGRQNRRLILLEGQVNPILSARIPPDLRPDMKAFLRNIAADFPHVILIPEHELPKHSPEDYADLTHITEDRQSDFTRWLANRLKQN